MNPGLARAESVCNQLGLMDLKGKYKEQGLEEGVSLFAFSSSPCMLPLYN